MTDTYPTGTDLDVSFTLRLPADASYGEVLDWLRFELGAVGSFDTRNPLNDHELHGNTRDVRMNVSWRRSAPSLATGEQ